MKHLVHLGSGMTQIVETPDFIDTTVDVPRTPQQLNRDRYLRGLQLREERERKIAEAIAHRDRPKYGPVTFAAMRHDQCRWPIGDKQYCGERAISHQSYCESHRTLSKDRTRA